MIHILFVMLIALFFACNIYEPQVKDGNLIINPVFPQPAGDGLHKTQAAIDRVHVTVTNTAGKTIINKDLSDTGSYLEGTFKVDAGTYSAQMDCYLDGSLVFTGSRAGISIQAGEKTIAEITLSSTTVATPSFNPAPATYTSAQIVAITCSTSDTDIYYTTNGSEPTTSSTQYSSAITISSTTTLKARAYKSGWTASSVTSGLYEITGTVAKPTFNPAPGTYQTPQTVTITCTTSGADIYYTFNGNDPTTSSVKYTNALSIGSTTTLKARAYKSGWSESSVQSGIYIINNNPNMGTVTDIDGNVYQTVKIGDQWWMAEDLKVTRYSNGDTIANVTSNTEWENLTTGAYCYYDNNSSYAADYGALYNWYAVNDSRNIAPAGWHSPTDEEWKELEMYLGMSQTDAENVGYRGTDEGDQLKESGISHWASPNEGATNSCGFTARPSGCRNINTGFFVSIGNYAYYWTATEYFEYGAWRRILAFDFSGVNRSNGYKHYGFSVRCVKD